MNHLQIIDILETQMHAFRREGINPARLRIEISPALSDELRASPYGPSLMPRTADAPPTFYGVPMDILVHLPAPGVRVVALAR